jgi:hypothetical protein
MGTTTSSLAIRDRSNGFVNFIYNNTTQVGSITTNGSSTSYISSSDRRLKENLGLLNNARDIVESVPVRTFYFKGDSKKEQYHGFFADEVQSKVPSVVSGTKDEVDKNGSPVYQGVDYSKLVPVLWSAMQDLYKEIETLKKGNAK